MTITTIPIEQFSGLNLVDQPGNVAPGSALDLMDVVLTERGRLTRRKAFLRATLDLGDVRSMAWAGIGAGFLLSSAPTLLSVVDAALAASPTSLARTAAETAYARYGTPSSERVYSFNGVDGYARLVSTPALSVPTVTKVDGLTGATTAAQPAPTARAGAVWGGENRLVVGGFGYSATGFLGQEQSDHHVYISEPGDPERFKTTSFLRLTPGDGDAIQAIAGWREMVFVFKRDKFFILTNVSSDSRGVERFNYRAVETGQGAVGPRAVAVGRDGVYFVSRNGLYRTRGDDPELLSRDVEALWTQVSTPFYQGGFIKRSELSRIQLAVVNELVMMSFTSSLRSDTRMDRIAVFDPREDEWSIWTPMGSDSALNGLSGKFECALVSLQTDGVPQLGYTAGGRLFTERIGSDGFDLPLGRFLGGFSDDGMQRVRRVPQMKVWGAGKISVGLRRDYESSEFLVDLDLGLSSDVWGNENWNAGTWTTALPVGSELVRRAQLGQELAFEVVGRVAGDAGWSVTKMAKHIAAGRTAAVERGR